MVRRAVGMPPTALDLQLMACAASHCRSSPVSSDFEEVGLEETRGGGGAGVGLGAGYSGVLVDSGDDSPSSDSPELPVVWSYTKFTQPRPALLFAG